MSVLVPSLKVYEAVYNKAIDYTFRKVVDINYCSCLGRLTEKDIKNHVSNWLYLNELSYIRKYKFRKNEKPELKEFLTFRSNYDINPYQMLKYLECIFYNIEIDTIKTGHDGKQAEIVISSIMINSYNLLKRAIDEIRQAIIGELPEYKAAEWYEFTEFQAYSRYAI
jgi:hypothetical protein